MDATVAATIVIVGCFLILIGYWGPEAIFPIFMCAHLIGFILFDSKEWDRK